ncbi:MAG: hypothetical protein ACI8V2_004936 [Candidatus Latescibacterota bacterium]|jgi:uncharacterized protein YbbC (DUF1343 family)
MYKYILCIVFSGFFSGYGRAAPVQMGVDVFLNGYTQTVKGLRVGLLTNKTARTANGDFVADVFIRHPDVNLVALFALEHGIDGKINAGKKVDDSHYKNLPVYSLYVPGDHQSREALKNEIDVLIYDMQDVGSRSYTYVWSLAKVMAVAALYEKRVIVLDRPNPLGGLTVDGPVTEEKWFSLIGLYPVPRVYGMTVGELAQYINEEPQYAHEEHGINCALTVIPMAGYRRNMAWEDVGHDWIITSPNIPTPASAVCFAATGTIGNLWTLRIGIGTETPFQYVGAPWINAELSARELNLMRLPGVRFRPMAYVAEKGSLKGQKVQAVFLDVVDATRFQPTRTEISILAHLLKHYPKQVIFKKEKYDSFDKAMGTSFVREALMRGDEPRLIWSRWHREVMHFSIKRQKYLLYRSGEK